MVSSLTVLMVCLLVDKPSDSEFREIGSVSKHTTGSTSPADGTPNSERNRYPGEGPRHLGELLRQLVLCYPWYDEFAPRTLLECATALEQCWNACTHQSTRNGALHLTPKV